MPGGEKSIALKKTFPLFFYSSFLKQSYVGITFFFKIFLLVRYKNVQIS